VPAAVQVLAGICGNHFRKRDNRRQTTLSWLPV